MSICFPKLKLLYNYDATVTTRKVSKRGKLRTRKTRNTVNFYMNRFRKFEIKGKFQKLLFYFQKQTAKTKILFFFVFLNTKNSLVHVGAPHLWLWFFCEIWEIFKNIFFKKHLRVTSSVPTNAKLYLWLRQINNTMEALQTWGRKLKNNGSFRLSFILLM